MTTADYAKRRIRRATICRLTGHKWEPANGGRGTLPNGKPSSWWQPVDAEAAHGRGCTRCWSYDEPEPTS